jgi:hypothetical protein
VATQWRQHIRQSSEGNAALLSVKKPQMVAHLSEEKASSCLTVTVNDLASPKIIMDYVIKDYILMVK